MAAWPFIASAGLPDAGNVAWILACPANAQNADLRIYRLQLRFATVSFAQPPSGLAAQRRGRSQDHRFFCANPVPLHLEVSLVPLSGPLRPAAARSPTQLVTAHADRPAPVHRPARRALAEHHHRPRSLARRPARAIFGHAGHRSGCLPARNSRRKRTGAGQRRTRQCLPRRRPGSRVLVADPRRRVAVVAGILDYRGLHVARNDHDPAGQRAGNRPCRAKNAKAGGGRAFP